ncbi:CDP-diacylglycerol--glycerol-3-phosphate 3-phosphatidyltransferase [Caminicella sporogenes]|uniref:CDP-diacylglycerol--glycerol-3-phosphate 3-phosphatidyltransferase n=1 Tax=Caminicella sporogenes TaxID=166485 RepID=UPI0025406CA3|nr:CDP-diacylglycerol--glycerol-3-phosphate 3-phosphatidyltransferase [Caminicella sporogenes]WIF94230.1 CDP-diacylglycerol--glycerol-3-phosphate 3-phosphatidyltransferase [Caminicella sporogenes]
MNIPNILTIFRFILIPVFIYFFFANIEGNILYATYIFILAGITDVLDGYIARKYNLVTKWGQAMDPLADKMMQITVLACFTIKKFLPIWVIIIIGIKELLMIAGGLFLYYKRNKVVVPANRYGKIATISFYGAMLYLIFGLPYSIVPVIFAIILTLLALANYVLNFKVVNKKSSAQS